MYRRIGYGFLSSQSLNEDLSGGGPMARVGVLSRVHVAVGN